MADLVRVDLWADGAATAAVADGATLALSAGDALHLTTTAATGERQRRHTRFAPRELRPAVRAVLALRNTYVADGAPGPPRVLLDGASAPGGGRCVWSRRIAAADGALASADGLARAVLLPCGHLAKIEFADGSEPMAMPSTSARASWAEVVRALCEGGAADCATALPETVVLADRMVSSQFGPEGRGAPVVRWLPEAVLHALPDGRVQADLCDGSALFTDARGMFVTLRDLAHGERMFRASMLPARIAGHDAKAVHRVVALSVSFQAEVRHAHVVAQERPSEAPERVSAEVEDETIVLATKDVTVPPGRYILFKDGRVRGVFGDGAIASSEDGERAQFEVIVPGAGRDIVRATHAGAWAGYIDALLAFAAWVEGGKQIESPEPTARPDVAAHLADVRRFLHTAR